jgi:hypothetical protein
MDLVKLIGEAVLSQMGTDQEKSHSIEVGKSYLIRTVTLHYTGRVERVTESDIALSDAAWIADTGRYSDSVKTGSLGEVEPYPDGVVVCRGGVIDLVEWKHDLPKEQK